MIQTHGERFFYHDMDSAGSTNPYHLQMAVNGSKGHYRLGSRYLHHFFQIAVDQVQGKTVAVDIFSSQCRIGFSDANDLYIFFMVVVKNPVDMVVTQTSHTNFYWIDGILKHRGEEGKP